MTAFNLAVKSNVLRDHDYYYIVLQFELLYRVIYVVFDIIKQKNLEETTFVGVF